ncbi:hypothetical protein SUGI_1175250 [Cryptomeria japonica]|nr:hypothetical protein SUGI_1175250 [Cryptomeria japonica]
MAPPKSTSEAWKHVTRNGTHIKCNMCQANIIGTLTRLRDHFLANKGGPGGGVQACTGATPELKAILEKELAASTVGKMKKAQKKQRIEGDISRFTSAMSSSSVQSEAASVPKQSGTLNNFWKPVEKQQVDDAVADLFYTSAIPFNVARNPHFRNAVQKIAEFGKGYTPPGSEAIRTILLQRSKDRVTEKLADVKATWKETGCTILSDGWSDMCQRPLINVLVSCPEAIHRGRAIANFIRNHHLTLSIYRQHASKELLRPCETRFASYYITLKRVVEEKAALRSIIYSNQWESSMLSKSPKGKNIEQIILNSNFWESAAKVLLVCEPIVDVLRMVDGDTPCLAACFLEPKLFSIDRRGDNEIMAGLYQAISRYVPNPEIAALIKDQSWQYKRGEGMFGGAEAKYDSPRMSRYRWWIAYGSSAPEPQEFAIRILSQGASSSACERNWSCFDHIHSKKRNKLLTGKLGDLVYVRSNLKLLMNKSAKNTSLQQTLEGMAMPDADEPDFADDELSSDTDDDDLASQPSALDDLELF